MVCLRPIEVVVQLKFRPPLQHNLCLTLAVLLIRIFRRFLNRIRTRYHCIYRFWAYQEMYWFYFMFFSVFTFSGCKSTQKLLYYNPLRQHGFFFLETSCFSFLIDFLIITKRIEIILGFIYAWAFMLISIKLIVFWIIWKLNSKLITNYEISHYISIVSLNVRAYRDIFFV